MNSIPIEIDTRLAPLTVTKHRSVSLGKQETRQTRATTFVKKLGLLTNRFKPSSSITGRKGTHPYGSEECDYSHPMPFMGTANKPYMSSPMLAVNCDLKTQPLSRHSVDITVPANNVNLRGHGHAKEASFGSGAIAQGLAVAALVAEAGLRQPEVSSPPSTIMQSSNGDSRNPSAHSQATKVLGSTTSEVQRKKPHHVGSGVNAKLNNTTTDGISRVSTSVSSDVQNSSSISQPPLSSKRPALRLSPLPPPGFIQKGMSADQKFSRLSPSVRIRPPPFPILELPALPTPTAESSRTISSPTAQSPRRGVARLNSMPMLPMQGADARENDPDHEHYGLDEDEEEEVDDNEDAEETVNLGSDDEDEDDELSGSRTLTSSQVGINARTSRTRAPRLPEILTTPNITFSSLFSSSSHSGSFGQNTNPADADAATPKVTSKGASNNSTSARWDYFSSFEAENTKDSRADPLLFDSRSHLSSDPSSVAQLTPLASNPPPPLPVIAVAVAPPSSEHTTLGADHQTGALQANAKSIGHTTRRPGMNHQASKSMIELFSPSLLDIKGKGKEMVEDAGLTILQSGMVSSADNIHKYVDSKLDTKRDTVPGADASEASHMDTKDKHDYMIYKKTHGSLEPHSNSPTLRRQVSMPTFSTSGPPPPYPTLQLPHHSKLAPPSPREDEGNECLPPYSNAIKLSAVLPRKMEFSAPGKPSRDRKWRRVHVVLEGTMLKVYDVKARGTIGNWWEKHVGVGDVSSDSGIGGAQGGTTVTVTGRGPGGATSVAIGAREPRRRMKWEEELIAEEARRSDAASESGARGADCEGSTPQMTEAESRSESPSRPQTRTKRIAASFPFLHPNRSRLSIATAPSSPRGSLQLPRSSCERDRRPSGDWSANGHDNRVSSDSNRYVNGDYSSRSSLSISAMSSSSNSRVSSPDHSQSESTQSNLLNANMNSNSNPRRHLRSQSQPLNSESNSNVSELKNSTSYSSFGSSLGQPEPDPKDLLRIYTLQHAESGLASDYTKRKNVVRVRLEGEQFLLQCTDVASVIEWIEGLQAATNIALDLDERPMPKGPIFPRRRRRRRPQATPSAANNASADQSANEGGTGTGSGTSS